MSEHSTPEERTEMPTERRMGKLRSDGQIYSSHELTQVISVIVGFFMLTLLWASLMEDMKTVMIKSFLMINLKEDLSLPILYQGFIGLLYLLAPKIFMLVGAVSATAILVVMLQTNWNVREKWIKFRWDLIHPLAGFKRIASIGGIVNFGKQLLKLLLILPIGYYGLKGYAPYMLGLMFTDINYLLSFTGIAVDKLFWRILYILIPLALFDYFWGKHQWLKFNKMTKDEVKDERKSVEGDEETKRKIINKGLTRILQRIKNTVPKADVVITNPTHYAIALQYDRHAMGAPTVVAKGKNHLAKRIREVATESGVPIIERKELARALYASTEVGSEIPYELFRAVAEVLAYVYKIKNPNYARDYRTN